MNDNHITNGITEDGINFNCVDCGVDTCPIWTYDRAENYMVHDEVWTQSGIPGSKDDIPEYGGRLCIGCLESRIGRQLCAADFTACMLNDPTIADEQRYAWSWRTPRLIARMSDQPTMPSGGNA